MQFSHLPVMLTEAMAALEVKEGGRYVDGTAGGGGHTQRLLELVGKKGSVLGLDQDPDAIAYLENTLKPHAPNLTLHHGNFSGLDRILADLGWGAVDGILLDLGLSSHQLEESRRGFSFLRDEPLDMRMNPDEGPTAADLVNSLPENELADTIYAFSQERASRRIARRIVQARQKNRFETSAQLADVVRKSLARKGKPPRIDPATRTFQALRMAVNLEFESLQMFFSIALEVLAKDGLLTVISFHSVEDRMVKRALVRPKKNETLSNCLLALTKKPIRASEEEIKNNPRARSAKLRAGRHV